MHHRRILEARGPLETAGYFRAQRQSMGGSIVAKAGRARRGAAKAALTCPRAPDVSARETATTGTVKGTSACHRNASLGSSQRSRSSRQRAAVRRRHPRRQSQEPGTSARRIRRRAPAANSGTLAAEQILERRYRRRAADARPQQGAGLQLAHRAASPASAARLHRPRDPRGRPGTRRVVGDLRGRQDADLHPEGRAVQQRRPDRRR